MNSKVQIGDRIRFVVAEQYKGEYLPTDHYGYVLAILDNEQFQFQISAKPPVETTDLTQNGLLLKIRFVKLLSSDKLPFHRGANPCFGSK